MNCFGGGLYVEPDPTRHFTTIWETEILVTSGIDQLNQLLKEFVNITLIDCVYQPTSVLTKLVLPNLVFVQSNVPVSTKL